MLWLSHKFYTCIDDILTSSNRNILPQNKIAKSQVQSGYSSTPPNKEVQKVLCLPYFDYFMVSFLWSIRVKTIENCRRCPFYHGTEKILSEIDLTFRKVTAAREGNRLRWSTANGWERFYSWVRSTTNIANYKPWLPVVGGYFWHHC